MGEEANEPYSWDLRSIVPISSKAFLSHSFNTDTEIMAEVGSLLDVYLGRPVNMSIRKGDTNKTIVVRLCSNLCEKEK